MEPFLHTDCSWLSVREEVPQMLAWEGGQPVAAVAECGRGVWGGSVLAGPEQQIALRVGNGHASPDRGWVKMVIKTVEIKSYGGKVYSQDSQG